MADNMTSQQIYEDIVRLMKKHQFDQIQNILRQLSPIEKQSVMSEKVDGCPVLFIATLHGHTPLVEFFLKECHAETEQNGCLLGIQCTPLWAAVMKEYVEVAAKLIEHGSNTNAVSSCSLSPLFVACRSGNLEMVRLLCKNGANVNSLSKNGLTPLMIFTYDLEMCKILLTFDANVNQRDINGKHSLIHAALKGQLTVFDVLLKHNAELMLEDYYGNDALRNVVLAVQENTMIYIITHCKYTAQRIVDEMKLMGALIGLRSPENPNVLYYWKDAVKFCGMKSNSISKLKPTRIKLTEMFGSEFQTMEDLQKIWNSREKIKTQCILVIMRNIGVCHMYTTELILTSMWEEDSFDTLVLVIKIIEYLLEVSKDSEAFDVIEYLTFGLTAISSLIEDKELDYEKRAIREELDIQMYLMQLQYVEYLFRSSNKANLGSKTILLQCPFDVLEKIPMNTRVKRATSNFLKQNFREYRNRTVLHNVINFEKPGHLVSKLLSCGADVDAMDEENDTPLHLLLKHQDSYVKELLPLLLSANPHLDIVNNSGISPLSELVKRDLIQAQPKSLQCLAATCVAQKISGVHYSQYKSLKSFIELHGSWNYIVKMFGN